MINISDNLKSKVVLVLQVLLGCTFIFSGFAKSVDPFGGYYKIIDYLNAFGWDWLKALGFFGSVLLSVAEFTLGVCMLLGVRILWTTIGMAVFMVVFTPLTLYLAIENPVTDCGCFGDALVISNWQTFWKNIIIDVLLYVVYIWRAYSTRSYKLITEAGFVAVSILFSVGLSVYGFINLPLIDFRPYYIGANIPKGMEVPEDAPRDVYQTTLVYEKDGVKKDFSLLDYPKDDSTWKFVENRSELISKGYVPPIHDFTMEHPDDGDITDDVIYNPGYSFLLVAHNVTEYNLFSNPAGAHFDKSERVNAAYEFAKNNGYGFYCMTATGIESDEMNAYKNATGAEYQFVNSDEIMLKTIIRSSPGLVLIKNGDIVNKWSLDNIPVFSEPLEKSELGQTQAPNEKARVLVCVVIMAALLYGVKFVTEKIKK